MKLFLLCVLSLSPAFGTTWNVDEGHTTAKFKVKHMMVSSVHGQVTGAKGALEIDEKDSTQMSGTITLDMSTISTGNAKRDTHLKDADFFEVTKFPSATFKIGKVTKGKGGKLNIAGELTLKGTTKPVTLTDAELTAAVKDPWGGTRRGLSGKVQLKRKDFGITWNKAMDGGGFVVGDDVDVEAEMELVAKPTEAKK